MNDEQADRFLRRLRALLAERKGIDQDIDDVLDEFQAKNDAARAEAEDTEGDGQWVTVTRGVH